jgi:hypothetical protein
MVTLLPLRDGDAKLKYHVTTNSLGRPEVNGFDKVLTMSIRAKFELLIGIF